MNRLFLVLLTLVAFCAPARAAQNIWYVTSPDHGQTYAYGSEQNHTWKMLGAHNNLALYATYTNEPFANGGNTRYDYFTFNFPEVKLGPGGNTFFYHADGMNLPVAALHHGFLGITEIKLLPTAFLRVKKVHGLLSMTLVIGVSPFEQNPDIQMGFQH